MKAWQFEGNGKLKEIPIPADLTETVAAYRDQLAEAAAEADDDL